MNFFERQEKARQSTTLLLFYFLLAIAAMNAAVYFGIRGFVILSAMKDPNARMIPEWWDPHWFIQVVVSLTVIILAGVLARWFDLRGGAAKIATQLGGRQVAPDTSDAAEKRVLNVVEEMSIAAGVPVPSVYLLKSEGINAFAAGWNRSAAVIGVTTGALKYLTRDELQGVVAHEFSHILNGDMRLNFQLIGILNGIELIGIIGARILRGLSGGRRHGSRKGNGGVAFIFVVGLALMVVGYIGFFFGMLIRSAISRQREYLADASAVQFTRNPAGIAGALKKIGGLVPLLRKNEAAHAIPGLAEVSHMLFTQELAGFLSGLFATHPPLALRVKAIDPAFKGEFPRDVRPADLLGADGLEVGLVETKPQAPVAPEPRAVSPRPAPPASHQFGPEFLSRLPKRVLAATRDPFYARALVLALLLDDTNNQTRARQLDALRRACKPEIYNEVMALWQLTSKLPAETFLALVDISLPALRFLSKPQYADFSMLLDLAIKADGQVSYLEYVLYRVVTRDLDSAISGWKAEKPIHVSFDKVLPEVLTLVRALARAGSREPAKVDQALEAGFGFLGVQAAVEDEKIKVPAMISLPALDHALKQLGNATPEIRARAFEACQATAKADGVVNSREWELLRLIAEMLSLPRPAPHIA